VVHAKDDDARSFVSVSLRRRVHACGERSGAALAACTSTGEETQLLDVAYGQELSCRRKRSLAAFAAHPARAGDVKKPTGSGRRTIISSTIISMLAMG
jgi:hypothetical protein